MALVTVGVPNAAARLLGEAGCDVATFYSMPVEEVVAACTALPPLHVGVLRRAHGKGPCVLTKVTAKRLAAMAWANEKESELIVARGGPWRDGSHGTAQTLNAKRGGQGDPWRVLCGIAKHKLKARGKLGAAPNSCAHGRRHRECKECGGAGICEHGKRRHRCKECGGAGVLS